MTKKDYSDLLIYVLESQKLEVPVSDWGDGINFGLSIAIEKIKASQFLCEEDR